MRRAATLAMTLLALMPAAALAANGGVGAPSGGTSAGTPSAGGSGSSSGGTAPTSTGGTTIDPRWVPSAGDGPAPDATHEPRRPSAGDRPVRSFARRDIPARVLRHYRAAARRYGVDWRLLAALGKNESDHGRALLPGVTSGLNFAACCSGPMQICQVASCGHVWQAYRRDGDGDGEASIYDPADSIHAAAALVADLRRMVGRNPKLVMAAYNAGPGAVQKYGGVPPFAETQVYVRSGVRYLRALRR